jgi:hypothetical protein
LDCENLFFFPTQQSADATTTASPWMTLLQTVVMDLDSLDFAADRAVASFSNGTYNDVRQADCWLLNSRWKICCILLLPFLGAFLVRFTPASCGTRFREFPKQVKGLRLYSGCIVPSNCWSQWGASSGGENCYLNFSRSSESIISHLFKRNLYWCVT